MEAGAQGHRKRLRERFERSGLDGFHDHEVLELLLSYAIPRRDLKPLAKELLAHFGSLAAVLDAPLPVLREREGIGPHAAALLSTIPSLLNRYQRNRWGTTPSFLSTRDAVSYLAALLGTERNEVFTVLALNGRNGLIASEEIQRGTINRTVVFPRLVVEAALKHRAAALIMAHNHPGGDPNPSAADRQLTRRLRRILGDLDIQVHDHIIIAGTEYYSFAERGELE